MNKNTNNAILASLTCDAYSLGSHWIYDEKQLLNLGIDWETLNTPKATWHEGKTTGDFTHYGDQTLFLLEYVAEQKRLGDHRFKQASFYPFWKQKMSDYPGYIDGATKNALEKMCSASQDLSICGHIAPLLMLNQEREGFLESVALFTAITHNSEIVLSASRFFAEILWGSRKGENIRDMILLLTPQYPTLEEWIRKGMLSEEQNTFETIGTFGRHCGIEAGFPGVIHLLLQEDDFKSLMQKNAQAGGDSSARGMVVAMILGAQSEVEIPSEWSEKINAIGKINRLLLG